jgi:hypothetical protein
MARAWIELDGERAGWGPARVVVAKLSRDGYAAQILTGTRTQTLIITGRRLIPSELPAIGSPPPAKPPARRVAARVLRSP